MAEQRMGLKERFSAAWSAMRGLPVQASAIDPTGMNSSEIDAFLRGGSETSSGAVVSERTAMRVAAAWRCVNIISGAVGNLPIDLIKRDGEGRRVPAVGHPLRRVLTVRPNLWQTPGEFRRLLQAHLLLRGNAFALKVGTAGRVTALIPIHPDRVTVEQEEDTRILYRVTTRRNGVQLFRAGEIMHLRGMSLDGVTGLSVLQHMRESLGVAIQAEQASARLFRNGTMAGAAFRHPGQLSDDAMARLKVSLSERGGAEGAYRPIVLEEGMDYTPLALTANDAQFLQQRDFQRYDIAMFFGVPPHMLGATEKTTSWGSGIEQQGIGFVTYTLNDWIRIWEETLKRDCLAGAEQETHDIRLFTQGLLRGDVKARWEAYTKALQWGVFSPDEVRALEDMNPRPDGGGGVYYEAPNTAGRAGGNTDEPSQAP
jgi:HK97 family phage portal protein